jgi:multiple sugar transport system substrate-binding protein
MSQEPKKVGRRTFLNYAIAIIATGVIVGATTYISVPKGEVTVTAPGTTVTTTKTVTTTVTGTPTTSPTITIPPGVKELSLMGISAPPFDKTKPGIERFKNVTGVNVIVDEATWDAYHEKIVVSLSAKKGIYDAVGIPVDWFMEFYTNNWMTSLNQFMEKDTSPLNLSDFYPVTLDSFSYGGKLYGIPWFVATMIGCYRTDLFEKAGLKPPKTWDEFVQVAQKLNNPPEVYGAPMPGKQSDHLTEEWIQLLWSFGGEFVKENKAVFNTKAGLDALQFMLDLIYKYKVVPPGFAQYSYDELATLFCEGKLAMYFGWPYTVALADDPTRSKIVGKWALFPRPGVAWGGTWAWIIPSDSNRKEAAYQLVKYLGEKETQRELALKGEVAVRRSILEDPTIQAEQPALAVMAEALRTAHAPPILAKWPEVSAAVAEELSKALLQQKPPQQALNDMEAKVNAILKG